MIIIQILLIVILTLKIFNKLTDKYINPYTLGIIFGGKGSGKSCTLQKLAHKYHKKGWNIYCNTGDCNFDYVNVIDCSKLWQVTFKPNSLLLIDEINLLWDNRDFKTFPKPLIKWFRLQRHYKVKVIAFSQTYDCDKKIRDMADKLYIINKYMRVFSICKCYYKKVVILRAKDSDNPASMTDDYIKMPIFSADHIYTFIPHWVKMYDSFKTDYDLVKNST